MTSGRELRSKSTLPAWLIFVTSCLCLVAVNAAIRRHAARHVAASEQAASAYLMQRESEQSELLESTWILKGMTVKEATELLRLDPPAPNAEGGLTIKFRHSTDGAKGGGVWAVTLWPQNGRVSDVSVASANAPLPAPSYLPLRTWNGVLTALAILAAGLCVTAANSAGGSPLRASRYGQVALGAAMAATLCWTLAVSPSLGRVSGPWAATALAVISLGAMVFGLPRRKPPAGLCVACRYNLTGNVSGVCPECGTVVGEGSGMTNDEIRMTNQ